jgi:hypothetical protein
MAIVIGILYLAMIAFFIYCYYKIAGRAGYSPWLGLLMILPIVNIVMLFMFAFKTWPIEEQGMVNPNTFN